MCEDRSVPAHQHTARLLARWVLAAFLATFILARCVVFLIMTRRLPDLYLHIGGTHVHHLNYGIFLLAGVGAYLLFGRPRERPLAAAAVIYGCGLALTFDEFGMWLHLGGAYWQRASFDAVAVIAAALGLLAMAPRLGHLRPRHWTVGVLLVAAVGVFTVLLVDSFRHIEHSLGAALERLEQTAPP